MKGIVESEVARILEEMHELQKLKIIENEEMKEEVLRACGIMLLRKSMNKKIKSENKQNIFLLKKID